MGQKNCCEITNKQSNQITKSDIDNLTFDKLDFNRGSTYKKLDTIATEITTNTKIANTYNILISRIIAHKQEHLLKILKEINIEDERKRFISHLETLDYELVDSLYYNLCKQKKKNETEEEQDINSFRKCKNIDDINDIDEANYEKYFKAGLSMIRTTEATNGENTSNNLIPVYIMANDENFVEIKNYWKQNKFFGIDPNCITFFLQQTLPVVDQKGQIILQQKTKVHLAPNGPADFFTSLLSFGIFKKIITQKVKYLHVIGVDNLLIKPLDPFFLGYSKYQEKDFVCKVVSKTINDEDPQMFIQKNDNTCKVMSSQEIAKQLEYNSQNCEGNLLNSPLFTYNIMISTDFLNKLAGDPVKKFKLAQSFHVIQRTLDWYDIGSDDVLPGQFQNAYCYEKKLGDMIELSHLNGVQLLKVNREEEFAPIINYKGKNSLEDAKISLSNLHKKWLGLEQKNKSQIIEIDPLVSYNGEQLDHIIILLQKYQKFKFPFHISSHAQLVEELVAQNSLMHSQTNNQNKFKKLVFFLRHGERGDRVADEKEKNRLEKSYDCHLTDHGCYQAQEAGRHIIEMIKEHQPNVKKIQLVSSPFLRCIMTAQHVAKGTGLQIINNEIKIENSVCEVLTSDILSECPFTRGLMLRENKYKQYVKDISVNDSDSQFDIPRYPEGESEYDSFERIQEGFKKITQTFIERAQNNELYQDTALVIVSHGGCTAAILTKMGIYDEDKKYPINNINGFVFESENQEQFVDIPKIICKQYDDHLPAAFENYTMDLKQ